MVSLRGNTDVRWAALIIGFVVATGPAEAGRRLVARADAVVVPAIVPLAPPSLPPATSPLDATLARPALSGIEEALDLAKMARARVSFTFAVDHAWLRRIDVYARDGLLAALAADPTWRLAEEEGILVAQRRVADADGWSVARTGFHGTGTPSWRVDLRFGPWPTSSAWSTSAFVSRVGADARSLPVRSFVVPGASTYGARATAISVEGELVAFDIYELGADDTRKVTLDALRELSTRIPPTAWSAAAKVAAGGEVVVGEPGPVGLRVTTAGDQLEVRGWVHADAPGWTWVRIVAGGQAWEPDAVGAGTRERIGWSSDPAVTSWLQGRFPVPPGDGFDAIAEVWTLPDDGGAPRLDHELPVRVPDRGGDAAASGQ